MSRAVYWIEGGIALESPEHAALATGCDPLMIVRVCDGLQKKSQAGIYGPAAHFRWDEPELDPPQDLFLDEDPVRRRLQRIRLELHDVVGPGRILELDGPGTGTGLRVLNGTRPEKNDPVLDGLLRESAALMTDLFKSEVSEVAFEVPTSGRKASARQLLKGRRKRDAERGFAITQRHFDQVRRLRDEGTIVDDIVRAVGLRKGDVQLLLNGTYVLTSTLEERAAAEPPPPVRLRAGPAQKALTWRRVIDRRRGLVVTQAHIDEVLRLRGEGLPLHALVERFGLPWGDVRMMAFGEYVLTETLERLAQEEREKAAQSAAAPIPIPE